MVGFGRHPSFRTGMRLLRLAFVGWLEVLGQRILQRRSRLFCSCWLHKQIEFAISMSAILYFLQNHIVFIDFVC